MGVIRICSSRLISEKVNCSKRKFYSQLDPFLRAMLWQSQVVLSSRLVPCPRVMSQRNLFPLCITWSWAFCNSNVKQTETVVFTLRTLFPFKFIYEVGNWHIYITYLKFFSFSGFLFLIFVFHSNTFIFPTSYSFIHLVRHYKINYHINRFKTRLIGQRTDKTWKTVVIGQSRCLDTLSMLGHNTFYFISFFPIIFYFIHIHTYIHTYTYIDHIYMYTIYVYINMI